MGKAIRIPIGVNVYGGTAVVEDGEHKNQILKLALSDGDSMNAFQQDICLGVGMIFSGDTSELRSSVLQRVLAIFADFEEQKLFRLMRETIAWEPLGDGRLELSFQYIDIESDSPQSFKKAYTVGA